MTFQDYHFITNWRFETSAERLYDLLSRPQDYARWMTSLKILVEPVAAGNAEGVGRIDRFTIKGYLPYSLCWELRCIEARRPFTFTSLAAGDLEGRGTWIFTPRPKETDVLFDWKIKLRKPILRPISFFLRPLFKWNHDWVMARWKEDLARALFSGPGQV